MDLLPIFGVAAAILTPLGSILASILTVRAMRKRDDAAAGTADRQVDVSEKDAHTKELEMLFSAFGASQESLSNELARVVKTQEALNEKHAALEKKHEALKEEHEQFREQHYREREEMIDHIVDLERLVPNPPGPPSRPSWMAA